MALEVHVLQLARVGDLVAGLVLGQDLHEGPQLQPPLLFGNSVPASRRAVNTPDATAAWGSCRGLGGCLSLDAKAVFMGQMKPLYPASVLWFF